MTNAVERANTGDPRLLVTNAEGPLISIILPAHNAEPCGRYSWKSTSSGCGFFPPLRDHTFTVRSGASNTNETGLRYHAAKVPALPFPVR